jgi:hypothetical protein
MIFELHPPQAAGPLRIGTTGHDIVEILKQLGAPQLLCRTQQSQPAWAVHRPSGLFISTYFDTDDRLEAIEFGRPDGKNDTITYDGLDVFTTPAADLITQLRQHTTVHQEENGHAFTAPSLLQRPCGVASLPCPPVPAAGRRAAPAGHPGGSRRLPCRDQATAATAALTGRIGGCP